MSKFKKFIKYIYWISGNIEHTYFRNGDSGSFIFTILITQLIVIFLELILVCNYGHAKLPEYTGYDKFAYVLLALILYLIIDKIFKNVPIKNNMDFICVNKQTKIFHIIIFILTQIFLFFLLTVILSPNFNIRHLKFC